MAGLLGTAGLVAIGVFGAALAPHDPNSGVAIVWRETSTGTPIPLAPPTLPDAQYWLAYRLTFLFREDPMVVPLDPRED